MKVVTIVGARPQFVKAAALSRQIRLNPEIKEVLVHTGQHHDDNLSKIFFDEMEIPSPQYHLACGGGGHGAMTGKMLEAIEKILIKEERPGWVLVFGDTNSTLAGALAACKLHIPVAHVEAGLRSYNRKMPEEINRILTDQCSDCLFTPSHVATKTLLREGFSSEKIVQAGDLMVDAALFFKEKAKEKNNLLDQLSLKPKHYVLATIHRQENSDDPKRLKELFEGLSLIAKTIPVVMPLHPRTKAKLVENNCYQRFKEELTLIDPVGFLEMIGLEANAQVIVTDSGGVQREAYFFKIPCVTLREETEWVELVEGGFNRLSQASRKAILESYQKASDTEITWGAPLYGEGDAAFRIVEALSQRC